MKTSVNVDCSLLKSDPVKRFVAMLGMVLLVACDRQQEPAGSATAFAMIGAHRVEVEESLKADRGTVLSTAPDTLVARVFSRDLARPMNVNLTFKEGTLAAVNYWPPAPARDWVESTPWGPVGCRTFLDTSVHPSLRDGYLYLGPLGRMYIGSDGVAVHPTPAMGALGAAAVVFGFGAILLTRRNAPLFRRAKVDSDVR